MKNATGVNTKRFTMVSSTSAITRPTQCPNTPMRCSMRAESGGLTIPTVVSTTTAIHDEHRARS